MLAILAIRKLKILSERGRDTLVSFVTFTNTPHMAPNRKCIRSWHYYITTFNPCVLTVIIYGAETLTVIRKTIRKLEAAQRAMARAMLGVTLGDTMPNNGFRIRLSVIHVVKETSSLK